jgi:hypothetical protein
VVADLAKALVFLAGLALLAYGAWLAWEPAGYMTGGLVLAAGAVLYERGARA